MINYILRRVLIFIPTLFIITLLAFIISVNAPGDPVERMMASSQTGEQSASAINRNEQQNYWREKLGLNLPLFYISMHSLSVPDTFYRIYNRLENETLARLISQSGDWNEISRYFLSVQSLKKKLLAESALKPVPLSASKKDSITIVANELNVLLSMADEKNISLKIKDISAKLKSLTLFEDEVNQISQNFLAVSINKASWRNYIPAISFHKNNQYHRWLFGDGINSKGLLRGDFGISYVTKQPVSTVIGEKIKWSLFFSLFSVLLAYLISIPLGAKAGAVKNSRFDKITTLGVFVLYSLPPFWVATLLLMSFANPDSMLFFPASGVKPAGGFNDSISFFEKIWITLPYLVLPVICYTYGSFAFLSRTIRISMADEMSKDYIRTARAKGLGEKQVAYKHALRNALFPAITVFANVFPFAIGGSVILETIFTIPGMGLETFMAIQNQNYPVIVAVFTITGMLTLVGYLVSDILYAVADPRISFLSSKIKSDQ